MLRLATWSAHKVLIFIMIQTDAVVCEAHTISNPKCVLANPSTHVKLSGIVRLLSSCVLFFQKFLCHQAQRQRNTGKVNTERRRGGQNCPTLTASRVIRYKGSPNGVSCVPVRGYLAISKIIISCFCDEGEASNVDGLHPKSWKPA